MKNATDTFLCPLLNSVTIISQNTLELAQNSQPHFVKKALRLTYTINITEVSPQTEESSMIFKAGA